MGKIRGTIIKTITRNERDGYSLLSVRAGDALMKIKGVLSSYCDGTPFVANVLPPEKGKDLWTIDTFEETSVGFDQNLIEGYLLSIESNSVRLSFFTVKKLLALISEGKDLFDITTRMIPDAAADEQNLFNKKIRLPRMQRVFREMIANLTPDGKVQYYLCNKFILDKMDFAMSLFRKTPREVCVRELGMTYVNAAAVTKKLNMQCSDDDVVGALGVSILDKAEKNGSTCIPFDQFKMEIQETVYQVDGIALSEFRIEKAMMHNNYIVSRGGYASFGNTLHSEEMIAERIRKLLDNRRELFSSDELNRAIDEIQKQEGITYADAQKDAFKLLRCTGLAVLTGGPGTGKTTVLNGIRKVFQKKYPLSEVVMSSPTGRAAQRMTEATGHEAMTVHRLVGIGRNQRGKSQIAGDFVIIDESSMLDSEMTAWLLMAISEKSLVLFVGDIDQLPSVGAGNVLKDLIQSAVIPVCRLQTVYRQSGESAIITNANKINRGESDLKQDGTFVVLEEPDDKTILDVMADVAKEALSATDDQIYGVQILATSHKGDASISAANNILQQMINPRKPGMKALKYGNTEFREGDKVITTQNNYEDCYFNGDIGVIKQISEGKIEILISDKTVYLQRQNLQDLSLGYCISIHKSQGSEFEHAIILLPEHPSVMLRRNLLYTAVTRAKKRCTIIAAKGSGAGGNSISKCARNIDNTKRVTLLPKLLTGMGDPMVIPKRA